jgi:hypothetical protein
MGGGAWPSKPRHRRICGRRQSPTIRPRRTDRARCGSTRPAATRTAATASPLVDYTIGFAVSGTPTSVNEQRVRDPATRTQLHQFFRSLPPDRFPTLVALGEHVWVDNRDQRFTAGLRVLVDGLEHARSTRQRPALGRALDHDQAHSRT